MYAGHQAAFTLMPGAAVYDEKPLIFQNKVDAMHEAIAAVCTDKPAHGSHSDLLRRTFTECFLTDACIEIWSYT